MNLVSSKPEITREVLVLVGSMQQWRDWVKRFAMDHVISRQRRDTKQIESEGVLYRGAISTRDTDGHCCTEVLKIDTYWRNFSPEELRMIDACAELAKHREMVNHVG